MPTITAQGKSFECVRGSDLHQVSLEHGIDLYNGKAKILNARGVGTRAVVVEGEFFNHR